MPCSNPHTQIHKTNLRLSFRRVALLFPHKEEALGLSAAMSSSATENRGFKGESIC